MTSTETLAITPRAGIARRCMSWTARKRKLLAFLGPGLITGASNWLPVDAKAFYGAIGGATLMGMLINFMDIAPIKIWAAVLNWVVVVPLMVMIMNMAMEKRVMGAFTLPRPLWAIGWMSTAVMAGAVAIMFLTW